MKQNKLLVDRREPVCNSGRGDFPKNHAEQRIETNFNNNLLTLM